MKPNELLFFTGHLATVIRAGIPITTGLSILAEQSENPLLRKAIQETLERIKEGDPLSKALSFHPKIFSKIYIQMIKGGEASGKLEEVLNRIGSFLEYDIETKARIKSATRYPKMVFGALIGAFLFAIYFILPNFIGLFKSIKTTLPLPTRMMLGLHFIFTNYLVSHIRGDGGGYRRFSVVHSNRQGSFSVGFFKNPTSDYGTGFFADFHVPLHSYVRDSEPKWPAYAGNP